jgi:phytoene dehydrogenase-like protein
MTVTVGIVGGGLAGMAAAVAAIRHGLGVELFEQTKHLGGRAGSMRDPPTGRLIDCCPHVALGCCANLADFCRQTGVADCFQRFRTFHFIDPAGRQYDFSASRWLPAPLHLLPGLLRLGYLTCGERWGIVRTLLALARTQLHSAPADADGQPTIGAWLRRHGQSERAIERFWSVVLVSALGETVDRASLAAARKVFVDGFLASRRAYELYLPQEPLGEIWQRVGDWLTERGATLHFGAHVVRVEGQNGRATGVVLRDGTRRPADFVVAAVPWRGVGRLFPPPLA